MMPKLYISKPSALEWIALACILTLAILLRIGWPGVVEFKRDEANLSYLTLDMVHGVTFPLLGIDSSVGVRNAPVSVYIMAPPYLLSNDPLPATQYVGWLNVIAVGILYMLTRRYYGPAAAIVATTFYAVSPWAVIYSRKIWAQDMLPPFMITAIGTALLGFLEKKRWAQLVHLPLLVITGQIHYIAYVFIPITLYLVWVGRRNLTRYFWWSIGLAVLLTLPYIIGIAQLPTTNNTNIVDKVLSANGPRKPITLSGHALEYAWFTVAGTNLHSLAGPSAFERWLAQIPSVYSGLGLISLLVVTCALWLVIHNVTARNARRPVDVAVLLWLFVTPLSLTPTWVPAYPHYMIPILPAAYMILGIGAAHVLMAWRNKPTARRLITAALAVGMLAIVIIQVWVQIDLHQFLNNTNTPNGFGTPLGYLEPIRQAILDKQPRQIIGELDGQYIGYHDETTIWNFLLYDVPLRRFTDDLLQLYPADPAIVLSHRCGQGGQDFNLRAGEGCLSINTQAASAFDATAYTPIPQAQSMRFENGLQVTAYQWLPAEGCLAVVWNTDQGPRREDYSFAVHFLNAQGQKILDADGLSFRGQYWRAGDVIVRKFCLRGGQERIPDVKGARLGMYTTSETSNGLEFHGVTLLDSQGLPLPEGWVTFMFKNATQEDYF